ncbi:unnamed protein product, partial [Vitis vinifera]
MGPTPSHTREPNKSPLSTIVDTFLAVNPILVGTSSSTFLFHIFSGGHELSKSTEMWWQSSLWGYRTSRLKN